MDKIVVQNLHQRDTLIKNYGKDGLILFNIWGEVEGADTEVSQTDVVWVANFRPLKRPEWIIKVAKALPQLSFTMVGGPCGDTKYYESIELLAKGVPNLHFLGSKGFAETNAIVSKSRLLCCTSTFEGFPNTFLQAWSADIPVVSTVDPSGVISTYHLGVVVETIDEFLIAIKEILNNKTAYAELRDSVENYFVENHSAEKNFQRLMEYICS